MKRSSQACVLGLFLFPPLAFCGPLAGVSFDHGDWTVACDNSRTCRAAGYQSDDDETQVSVLLTRAAGAGQPVKGELSIGMDEDAAKAVPANFPLAMTIDGKSVGRVMIDREKLQGALSDAQVAALLAALARSPAIAWSSGKDKYRLSASGASAVLLKMDDFQGRIGTRGALVRKGDQDESKVLPALPLPVVVAAKVLDAEASDTLLPASVAKKLRAALLATLKKDDCFGLPDDDPDVKKIAVARLDERRMLATMPCWRAAYNDGDGYWVVNRNPPWQPVLVTTSGSDYGKGEIVSGQKGRGLGDCISNETWTWDGNRFVQTEASSTGLCKGMTGGSWTLSTLAADVRKP